MNTINAVKKIKGTSSIKADNTVSISFTFFDTRFGMTGDINSSNNFIAGEWKTNNYQNGLFYFHKQMTEGGENIVSIDFLDASAK